MLDDNKLYNTAYKHLLYRIHFGFYPSGFSLPPVSALCQAFGVSRSTIHSALKMLQEEHYISRRQGRSPIVTYTARSDACRERYLAYCRSTKDALLDVSGISWMMWPEIMLQGLRLCGGRDLDELAGLAAGMSERAEYPYLDFGCRILARLGNPLLLNLYLSTALFGHCTPTQLREGAYRREYMTYLHASSLQILALRRAGRDAELKDLLVRYYRSRSDTLVYFYGELPPSAAPDRLVPYRWNYHTERPSAGFGLAMGLLREIYASFRPMDYLPSLAALAERYALPVATVRRAIQILNDIGVVQSVNGQGTRVIVGSGVTVQPSRLSTPNMKKVLLPYLQSVQAILLICRDVALALFPTLPEDAVEEATAWLREILASGDYYPTFGAAFKLLLIHSPSPALREILGGLMYFQYLGYPLRDLSPNEFRYDPTYARALLKGLEDRDGALFADTLQDLMGDIFRYGKQTLLDGGVSEARTIADPTL